MATVIAGAGAGLLWAATHWRGRTSTGRLANPFKVPANFGWGITPNEALAAFTLTAVLVGVVVVGWQVVRSGRQAAGPGARAIAAGLVVLFAGTAPFLTYYYAPLGAGDRLNWMSALGAALVLAGLLELLLDHSVALGAVTSAALVLVAVATLAERTDLWAKAGRDGGGWRRPWWPPTQTLHSHC